MFVVLLLLDMGSLNVPRQIGLAYCRLRPCPLILRGLLLFRPLFPPFLLLLLLLLLLLFLFLRLLLLLLLSLILLLMLRLMMMVVGLRKLWLLKFLGVLELGSEKVLLLMLLLLMLLLLVVLSRWRIVGR